MDCIYTIFSLVVTWYILVFLAILFGDCNIFLQLAEKLGKSPKTLKQKVVWITGAASGIGESLAYELAKVGCKLILSDRRETELERVKKCCIEKGNLKSDNVMTIHLDMTHFDLHQSAVEKVIKTFQQIDILVNNAGRSQRAEWVNTSLEVDKQVLNVNVLGVLSLTKLVLPHMVKRKQGHIVNTSSISGKMGTPSAGSYTGSKHAIQGWFDSLRLEVQEHNIYVTNICPGPVFSNILDTAFTEEEGKELRGKMLPSENLMSTQRCAQLISIAIANKLDEVWISQNPILFFLYINQYCPVLANIFMKRFGLMIVKRIREGRY